jgi:hypothetical protein
MKKLATDAAELVNNIVRMMNCKYVIVLL